MLKNKRTTAKIIFTYSFLLCPKHSLSIPSAPSLPLGHHLFCDLSQLITSSQGRVSHPLPPLCFQSTLCPTQYSNASPRSKTVMSYHVPEVCTCAEMHRYTGITQALPSVCSQSHRETESEHVFLQRHWCLVEVNIKSTTDTRFEIRERELDLLLEGYWEPAVLRRGSAPWQREGQV